MSSHRDYGIAKDETDVLDEIYRLEHDTHVVISDRNRRYVRGYPFPDPCSLGLEGRQRYKRFLEQEKEYLQDIIRKMDASVPSP